MYERSVSRMLLPLYPTASVGFNRGSAFVSFPRTLYARLRAWKSWLFLLVCPYYTPLSILPQPAGCYNFSGNQKAPGVEPGAQLVKKGFDKLVDGEASSPATATLSSFC